MSSKSHFVSINGKPVTQLIIYLYSSLLLNPTATGGSGFNNDDEADYYTEHDTRKRDISLNDIVHKVSLNEFIQVTKMTL